MPLPDNCADCSFHQRAGSHCRRHAPGPAWEEYEITKWPTVSEEARCGSGEKVGDGLDKPVPCRLCLHWFRPGDAGLNPDYRQGLTKDWWSDSGHCTRYAPSPSGEERDGLTFWRVTHRDDGCGDGEEVRFNATGE